MIPVCRKIGESLARIDPPHAAAYQTRTEACVDSLQRLDEELRMILAPARGVPFVATHNAWAYLCRRYGLRQAEVLQEAATREPGPRRLVELIHGASRVGARAVFTEVQVSSASAQTLAAELRLRIMLLDPQGTPSDPARNRYFDLLRWNAHRMAAALAGAPGGTTPEEGGAGKGGSS
jgi:zinc transport system substrate-binding protein